MSGLDLKGFIEFLKQLDKLYNKHIEMDSEETEYEYETENGQKVFLTPDRILGIVPKHKIVYDILKGMELEENTINLDYRAEPNEVCSMVVDGKYLRFVLEIVKRYEFVRITTRKDFPLKVETKDFIFYIAPKIIGDDVF